MVDGDRPLDVTVDKRDIRGGEKSWQWVKRGVPVRVEVGPRDIDADAVVVYRRDKGVREKVVMKRAEFVATLPQLLDSIQQSYFDQARALRDQHICRTLTTFNDLKAYFTPKNAEKPEIHGGFAIAKWAGDAAALKQLDELKITIRCMPFEQSGSAGKCIVTGRPATKEAIFAKAY